MNELAVVRNEESGLTANLPAVRTALPPQRRGGTFLRLTVRRLALPESSAWGPLVRLGGAALGLGIVVAIIAGQLLAGLGR